MIGKWKAEEHGGTVFDLGHLYHNRGGGDEFAGGIAFVTHEFFHFQQYHMFTAYGVSVSSWLLESGAEYGPAMLFPNMKPGLITAGLALAPAYPLGFEAGEFEEQNTDEFRNNPHIFSKELSIIGNVRGGHHYATWYLWWFISEHAGLPEIVGQMYALDRSVASGSNGKLSLFRLLLQSNDLDFWRCLEHIHRPFPYLRFQERKRTSRHRTERLRWTNGNPWRGG